MRILSSYFIDGFYSLVNPIGDFLERAKIHPHAVTIFGFILSVLTAILFWKGFWFFGGVALILSGACDALDGRLARRTNRVSEFGAFLDSTMDRYSEVVVFMGLAAFFHSAFMGAVIILAMSGSLLTSYVRARAEGMGLECKRGLMQRPERITFIAAGAIFSSIFDLVFSTSQPLMKLAILGIAVFSNYTVIQRMIIVRNQNRK
ncbi:MAG: CDP-alcohol phosphatidyltransferase family protein [candidate division Zixibacteria bacterium]